MSDEQSSPEASEEIAMNQKLRVESGKAAIVTVLFGLVGALLFAVIYVIPMPFIMVSLLKFGLIPALAIIAVVAGIRGPLAGFITGYLGLVLHDLVFYNTVISFTLPAIAYGVLGLIAGLPSYDLTNGRSLGKLSALSTVGLVFAGLLLVVFSLYIDQHNFLVGLGFIFLPLLTMGLPSVILITPILARIWSFLTLKIKLPWDLS